MLGKLLKYDFKANFKYFLPMSIFMLLYSCLGTLLFRIDGNTQFSSNGLIEVLTVFAIIAFVIMIIGYIIVTQGIIVVNFYKSMVTDTGYLTHTLPVSKIALLASKLISGAAIVLLSYVVSVISTLIMFDIPANALKYRELIMEVMKAAAYKEVLGSLPLFILSFTFALLASTIFSLSMYFMCIAFGQLMSHHKVIGSFVSYFVIQFIIQILCTILTYLSGGYLSKINDSMIYHFMSSFFFGISGFTLLLSAGMIAITHYVFKRKLNLD